MRVAALILLISIAAETAFAEDPKAQKLGEARAAAVAMVRPSGPLRIDTPQSNTPEEWRARGRIVGTYADYSNRYRFVLPYLPYYYPYGYGFGYFGGFGFFGGFGGPSVGSFGYSTW